MSGAGSCGAAADGGNLSLMNVYYLAEVRSVASRSPALPDDVTVRPVAESDIPALADVFLRAYGPAVAGSPDEAATEIRSAFGGTWGVLWPAASPAAWRGEELAGAVLSVRRPSWEGAPDRPWIIDVFTDPRSRRAGIARGLMAVACGAMQAAGEPVVGLTVEDTNDPAITLYRSLGFAAAI